MSYEYKYECSYLTWDGAKTQNIMLETPQCLYKQNVWAESADLEVNCPFYADQAQPIQKPHTEKLNQLIPRMISFSE